jgi:hypothetical protein
MGFTPGGFCLAPFASPFRCAFGGLCRARISALISRFGSIESDDRFKPLNQGGWPSDFDPLLTSNQSI